RPYVILKAGMTLDGQIATASGDSRWITSKQSRHEVHQLRADADAILIGVGTVIADDPSLTARTGRHLKKAASRQPLRIVVDSTMRAPLTARIFRQQNVAKTLVATTKAASEARVRRLKHKGIDVVRLPSVAGQVSLAALIDELGRREVTSLLVEGGSEINAALLKAKLIQHVRLYIAPALLGGTNAKGLIGGRSPLRLAEMLKLKQFETRIVGGDIVVEGDV
ncbi:bifunctional diaminohydroxyphosphoribosylaminopyrimidine deaminase/5-amino-6-(5-phosphoribosylamino)uracil reductase RibD, partial [Petrachloros mirabilis]